jgi:hypothetical protein
MPKTVRKYRLFPLIIQQLARSPLFKELPIPQLEHATGRELHRIGQEMAAILARTQPAWEAAELIADALADALGDVRAAQLQALGNGFGMMSGKELGTAALGALTVGTLSKIISLKSREGADIHDTFETMAQQVAIVGVNRYLDTCRKDFQEFEAVLNAGLAKSA